MKISSSLYSELLIPATDQRGSSNQSLTLVQCAARTLTGFPQAHLMVGDIFNVATVLNHYKMFLIILISIYKERF